MAEWIFSNHVGERILLGKKVFLKIKEKLTKSRKVKDSQGTI
jgi:hypothetical protein